MKRHVLALTPIRILVVLACFIVARAAAAQTSLPTWTGSFTYDGTVYDYTMVGTAPSTQTSTTIDAYVVPVKLVFSGCVTLPCSFDPSSIIPTVTASPVFDSTTTYTQGTVDVGTTQYIDAFQRGNFWGIIGSSLNPGYHLLLGGPTTLSELTITVPSDEGCIGSHDYGFPVGEVHDSWLFTQLENYVSVTDTIQPNTLPIFVTYNAVIAVGMASCDGVSGPPTQGVHFSDGGQTYVQFGYLSGSGSGPDAVQPDVSILSHEVGEWADDPFNSNYPTPCGTDLEVGDPLIGHNYVYTVGGFNYHLQDLAFLPYFGAPTSTSVNGWFSFQGENDNGGGSNIPCGNFD
jgi:hypothetical protein